MLTQTEISDCDAVVNLLRRCGALTAREIYAVNGKTTARVLGHLVHTGRVMKIDRKDCPVFAHLENAQPDTDWADR